MQGRQAAALPSEAQTAQDLQLGSGSPEPAAETAGLGETVKSGCCALCPCVAAWAMPLAVSNAGPEPAVIDEELCRCVAAAAPHHRAHSLTLASRRGSWPPGRTRIPFSACGTHGGGATALHRRTSTRASR